jgi:Mn-dependent DtxR family transcriptional regulator
MQRGRPRLFETEEAWEIYTNLPPEQRTYTNVAKILSDRLNLDPPLAAQAISARFIKAGLVEKKPRGAPKLKEKTMDNKTRSRLKRYRKKVMESINETEQDP